MRFHEKVMMDEYLNEAPIAAKGWDDKSVEKFGKTIGKGPKEKGFFDACVNRMRKHMGDQTEGFCAAVKDRAFGNTMWRGKDKKAKK